MERACKGRARKVNEACVKCLVSGRVQGVWYRGSAQDKARELNLRGYAKNLPDGRVEVLACGQPEALEELVVWLAEGPPMARVAGVERHFVGADAHRELSGFVTL